MHFYFAVKNPFDTLAFSTVAKVLILFGEMIDFLSSCTEYQQAPLYVKQIILQADSTALNVLNLV